MNLTRDHYDLDVEVRPIWIHVRVMTRDEYNTFCSGLPATSHVVQWGGAHVWKVGGKVFAIATLTEAGELAVTFKVSPLSFDIMKDQPGLRPAPYLASRGMKWIQNYAQPGLDDEALGVYIRASHRLVADGLPKKTQARLGLLQD